MPLYDGKFFDHFLLRATERVDLNDPFEFLPPKDLFDEVIEFHKNWSESEWAKNSTYEDFCKSFFMLEGVISFTETRSNLLMWSHYAQKHSGLVIEFDVENDFFETIKRVRYDNIKPNHIHIKDLEDLFFIKSDDWIYEKEYRIVNKLSKHNSYITKSDMKINPAKNSAILLGDYTEEMYMFRVPKNSIKSVTFGCNIEPSWKEKITNKIRADKELQNVILWQAKLSKDYYYLIFEEIKNI